MCHVAAWCSRLLPVYPLPESPDPSGGSGACPMETTYKLKMICCAFDEDHIRIAPCIGQVVCERRHIVIPYEMEL